MSTNIYRIGGDIAIKEGNSDPDIFDRRAIKRKGFNDTDVFTLEAENADGRLSKYEIPLADLEFESVAPADKAAAYVAMATVFPNAGGAAITTLTYSEAAALVKRGTVVPGMQYHITDAASDVCDLGIIVTGMPGGKGFSLAGTGIFLNADHQQIGNYDGWEDATEFSLSEKQGKWDVTEEGNYTQGNMLIYDGLHFCVINTEQFNGDNPSSNNAAYLLVPKTAPNVGYIEERCAVEYDFKKDWLQKKIDTIGNEVGTDYQTAQGLSANPIAKYQWGNNLMHGNKIKDIVADVINSLHVWSNKICTPEQSTFDEEISLSDYPAESDITLPNSPFAGVITITEDNGATINITDASRPPFPINIKKNCGAQINLSGSKFATNRSLYVNNIDFVKYQWDSNASKFIEQGYLTVD